MNLNVRNTNVKMEEVVDQATVPDDFVMDFPLLQSKTIKHYRQIVPVQIHHFYISGSIKDVNPYLNLINTLKTSEQHDTIFIYINTPGGDLLTTLQIVSAIKSSMATVITCMEGQVASAGTFIFLAGQRYMVAENSFFMAHNYSAATGGKGFEIKTRQKFDEAYFPKLINSVYKEFLTEEEIESLMEDRDVWLDADEVTARLGDKIIKMHSDNVDTQSMLEAVLGENNTLVIPIKEDAPKPKKPKTRKPKVAKRLVD